MDASVLRHPADETLSAYGHGKLDERSAELLEQHIESCMECRRRVAELPSDGFIAGLRDSERRFENASVHIRIRGSIAEPTDAGIDCDASASSCPQLGQRPPTLVPHDERMLPPGLAQNPDYEILGELGRGGMGVVYLAHNKLMDRIEVLKTVSGDLVHRASVLDRFVREIRSAARLRHFNIVAAYAAMRFGDSIVFAMEYVDGCDLSKLVKIQGPLQVASACNFIYQAALGLQYAHENGMVHRDIKPSNLILARSGTPPPVKILDFGLAKATHEGPTGGALTLAGQMLGTPEFIAPEQSINAHKADIRADIYSLGCTLYYLLTASPPFHGESVYEILQAHHFMDAKPLDLVRTDVASELAAIVGKMMAKEPDLRFREPKEIAEALEPFFGSYGLGNGPPLVEFSQRDSSAATDPATPAVSGPGLADSSDRASTLESSRPSPAEPSLLGAESNRISETPVQAAKPARSKRWIWPLAAVAIVTLGIALAFSGITIRTKAGLLVLDGLPPDAAVFVDGDRASVSWPGGGQPAEISVRPGEHQVEVKKGGFRTQGESVTMEFGGEHKLRVRLIPIPLSDVSTVHPALGAETNRLLFFDDFSEPESGWPRDQRTFGYSGGVYFIEGTGPHCLAWGCPGGARTDWSCEVDGRVFGGDQSSWGVVLKKDQAPIQCVQVRINRKGELFIEPGLFGNGKNPKEPRVRTIVHPAIKDGNAYNTLLVGVHARSLEVYVNSVPVCAPVALDWDMTPCGLLLGVYGSANTTRAEFDNVEIRKLGPVGEPPRSRIQESVPAGDSGRGGAK